MTAMNTLDSAKAAVEQALAGLPSIDCTLRVVIEAVSDPEAVAKAFAQEVRVCKAEERYVLGIVLEPQDPDCPLDSQGDVYTAETIRRAAHLFMEEYRNIGLQHSGLVNDKVKILETWIQHEDTVIGGQNVKAGSWLMAVRVIDDQLWEDVKAGRLTGFSIGGTGKRTPITR